jgi:hypothetical protein
MPSRKEDIAIESTRIDTTGEVEIQ